MYHAILVPVDGPGTGNRAASGALALAARLGARVTFLHVPETRVHAPAAREVARAYGDALLGYPAVSMALILVAALVSLRRGASPSGAAP